jgi:class 3 adenylate cyclase
MPGAHDKPFIASILFLDIVGYSKYSVEQQHEIKEHFTALLSAVIESIQEAERIAIDTGDGAAICFLAHPEVALQVALTVRSRLAHHPEQIPLDYQLSMGINIGPVRVVTDINRQRNVIGDGINAAQRVLGFASPGQILVSSAFHDIVAFLTTDHMNMFRAVGTRADKHGREHSIYEVAQGFEAQVLHDVAEDLKDDLDCAPDDGADDASRPPPLPQNVLLAIETKYAQYVGPIAKVLVRNGVRKASGAEGLCDFLSDMIADAAEKRVFRDSFFGMVGKPPAAAGQDVAPRPPPSGSSSPWAIPEAHLAAIEAMLTQHIGPIAKVVVKRHAASSSSVQTLCENLAQHIESEEKQKSFIEQAVHLLEE